MSNLEEAFINLDFNTKGTSIDHKEFIGNKDDDKENKDTIPSFFFEGIKFWYDFLSNQRSASRIFESSKSSSFTKI